VFKLEAEDGTWLPDIRVVVANWKPGDRRKSEIPERLTVPARQGAVRI
jgi:hypothetical protein